MPNFEELYFFTITMARFYLSTALHVAIVAIYSSPSTLVTALEATAGDEFLSELAQVEDSGKKPVKKDRDRELEWWHDDGHDDDGWGWKPPTKKWPTKKKPTKKPWGWKPRTKWSKKRYWGW